MQDNIRIKLQKDCKHECDSFKFNLALIELKEKYPNGIKIKQEKLKDLEDLCRFVSLEDKTFYEDIIRRQEFSNEFDTDDKLSDDDMLIYNN